MTEPTARKEHAMDTADGGARALPAKIAHYYPHIIADWELRLPRAIWATLTTGVEYTSPRRVEIFIIRGGLRIAVPFEKIGQHWREAQLTISRDGELVETVDAQAEAMKLLSQPHQKLGSTSAAPVSSTAAAARNIGVETRKGNVIRT